MRTFNLGRTLTKAEKRQLKDQSPAVAIKDELHKKTGTYKGKNSKKKYTADAKDQKAAKRRDQKEIKKLLKEDKKKQKEWYK